MQQCLSVLMLILNKFGEKQTPFSTTAAAATTSTVTKVPDVSSLNDPIT